MSVTTLTRTSIFDLARKALRRRFHGVTPDSSIPINAVIDVEVKRWVKKNGLVLPTWEKMPPIECMLDDLLTSAGRDMIHNASFMNGSQPAQGAYYAISNASGLAPAVGDTTLSGEISTPTHMVRHLLSQNWGGVTESYTHTAGGNTCVMVSSFENNTGSGSITVYGYANFNATSSGTMVFESTITATTLNSATGAYDVLKLTITFTLG